MLHQQMLDEIVCHKLGIIAKPPTSGRGRNWSRRWRVLSTRSDHRMVGKYVDLTDSYKSLKRGPGQRGIHARSQGDYPLCRRESIENDGLGAQLKGVDAVLVPGGFGKRGRGRHDEGYPVRAGKTGSRISASAWACSSL